MDKQECMLTMLNVEAFRNRVLDYLESSGFLSDVDAETKADKISSLEKMKSEIEDELSKLKGGA